MNIVGILQLTLVAVGIYQPTLVRILKLKIPTDPVWTINYDWELTVKKVVGLFQLASVAVGIFN